MDIKHDLATGSLVNISQKPPTKGRKKKSAIAKLAEKKRQSSECGSNCGSTTSLRSENGTVEKTSTSNKDTTEPDILRKNIEKTAKFDRENTIKGVSNKEEGTNIFEKGQKPSKDVSNHSNNKTDLKQLAPLPVPRKTHVESSNHVSDSIIDGVVEGIVVSIYDNPSPQRANKDISQHVEKKETNNYGEGKLKRELFPNNEESNKGAISALGQTDSKPGVSSLNDLPSCTKEPSQRRNVVELSPPAPMDVGSDSDNSTEDNRKESLDQQLISRNAPPDAVHRFRFMRMTPDRSKSEESLKNVQFTPKPPTTPKSNRSNLSKGEKRNRDANSSGEEHDTGIKKQSSIKAHISDNILYTSHLDSKIEEFKPVLEPVHKGIVVSPNVKEVKGVDEVNMNQNMNEDPLETHVTPQAISVCRKVKDANIDIGGSDKMFDMVSLEQPTFESLSARNKVAENGKVPSEIGVVYKERKKVKKHVKAKFEKHDDNGLASPGTTSIDTIGSASDLIAVSKQYEDVLRDKIPMKTLMNSELSGFESASIIPDPKPNAGKLEPIQPKPLPPPLPQDMKSTSLRTSYKTDPSYTMSKFFGRSLSGQTERDRTKFGTMSQRSVSQTLSLHALPTREARDRMKQGTMGATLFSASELDRYFPERKVGMWVGTWNMAEIKDCAAPLDDFLLPEISEYVQDIYAIGTQENSMNKKEWEILLQETIGPSHVLFHSVSHGALHLAVFIKRDLIWFCTVPEDDIVQTRAVTMVKTKGAIAVGFQFFGTSFLFINCHFAPGDEKKKERIDDFNRIIKNLNLPKQGHISSPNGSATDVTTRFDCVFWMGDLNFRIEVYKGKQAVEDIVKYIEEQEHKNFEDLLSGDQLTKLITEGNIFQGFQEGRINFRPTYKYDIGESSFDTSSKNRIPSYTDRVLFRARKKNSITCTFYDSPASVKISDHRPVFAIFDVALQPSRDCVLPLAAGQFDRTVYTEANSRRSKKVELINTLQKRKDSKVCSVQ